MQPMYPGIVNSPQTELASAIDDEQTTIPLLDASVLPAPPNLATLGTGEDAETILYTGVEGNTLTGVTRGFQGTPKAWAAGTKVARLFTAYDHEAFRVNIIDHEARIEQNTSAAQQAQQTAQQVQQALGEHLNDFVQLQFGERPYISTEPKTYYIDAVNGNDENDGESPATAFKTWAKVESMIPRILLHAYTIRIIGNLPETVVLRNVITAGMASRTDRLIITGDTEIPSNHQVNGVKFVSLIGTDGGAYLGVSVEKVRSTGLIEIYGCIGVTVTECEPRAGIEVGNSLVRISECDFGTDIVQDAIVARAISRVFTRNNVGNATGYGLMASEGSTIFKYGSQPTGTLANENIYQAGEIK